MGIKNITQTLQSNKANSNKLVLEELDDIKKYLGINSNIEALRYCIHQQWKKQKKDI